MNGIRTASLQLFLLEFDIFSRLNLRLSLFLSIMLLSFEQNR